MSRLDRETVDDLMHGRLPWTMTKGIMSGYKDQGRFATMIAILQDRVAWEDPILLPIGEHLFIVEKNNGRLVKCTCGHEFGDAGQNWKMGAAIIVRDDEASLREIYPHADLCDPAWMEIREFICPHCARLLEVEACAPGYPVVDDFTPDIDGFYREWLDRPLDGPD